MSETLTVVRKLVANGHVRVSQHAVQELADDGIDLDDALAGIQGAVVVEDYPDYHKGPSVLCLQRSGSGEPIHVLWGLAARGGHSHDHHSLSSRSGKMAQGLDH